MAYENTGVLAFANALSNAGTAFGNAMQERQRRQSLLDLAPLAQSGDWAGASKMALEAGNESLGIKFAIMDQEQRLLAQQRANDAAALSSINGGATSGGVTPNPQPINLPGGRYGVSQAYDLIKKVGGTDEEARMLAAISQPESSGNPMAHNPRGRDDSYGLWQINMRGALGPERMKQFGLSKAEDLYNPETNAKAALALARSRGGYGDWSAYTSGKYQAFLPNGQPVQVADASGAIPQSAGQPQPQSGGQVDALMSRRQNIMRALSQQGISDNARQQLNTMLRDTEFQIERIDRQTQQPGAKVQQEVEQRYALGQKQGLTGEALQAYALTGKLPKEDQVLTAGDRDAIRSADENIQASQNVISALTQAKEMSKAAFGFPGAGVAAKAGALFGNETAIATAELDNIINGQALDSLRSIFGGNPTEGERKILLDLQGSSSQPDAVRQKIFDRAISAAQKRLQFNQDRAGELRGGTYYKPRDQQPQNATAGSSAPPSDAINQARAAIARGADRAKVIERLTANGINPSGL